jgi:BirA family biotin operon repressor/biotin-[acetyl-CoA-carboxylase] ligase
MSTVLRPSAPTAEWPRLSLVAGEAVAAAIRAETGLEASLRHPNDVVVSGRKLVGVLPEARDGRVVLGIGVNVNQTSAELRRRRSSRRRRCGQSSAGRSSGLP